METFCAARSQAEVIATFEAADAAIGPVLDMRHRRRPARRRPRGDHDRRRHPMPNLLARLSATPGVLRWPGRPLDADGDAIRADGWG